MDKFFNDSVKNGKKQDGSVVIWVSHILNFIDWYDLRKKTPLVIESFLIVDVDAVLT